MILTHLMKCRQRPAGTPHLSQNPLSVSQHQHKHTYIHDGCIHNNPGVLFGCEPPQSHEQQPLPNGPPREPKPYDAQSDLRILLRILLIALNAGGGSRQQTRLLAVLAIQKESLNPGSSQGNSPIKNLVLSPSSQPHFLSPASCVSFLSVLIFKCAYQEAQENFTLCSGLSTEPRLLQGGY